MGSESNNSMVTELLRHSQRKMPVDIAGGKINDEDHGALCVGVGKEDGCVKLTFPIDVKWATFPPDQAVELAILMIRRAKEIGLSKPFTLEL
jgi:hypothetical protein